MSKLDKRYTLKLDTKGTFFNPTPQFSLSDNETSDMLIRVTNNTKLIDMKGIIAVMVAIDPNGIMHSDFVELQRAEEGLLYCNLNQSLKNVDGTWKARLMCIYGEERIVTSTFSYKVNTDEFVQLNQDVVTDDRFGTLTEMLSRFSTIENTELARQQAETGRVEAEKQREIVKEKLISDIEKLILDTNSKVDDNLLENSNKVDKLISDTTTKIDSYKTEKDEAIQQDLQLYKQETTKNIDEYKLSKDIEINKNLSDYKTSTTTDIETYKNNKNAEINQYKAEKDLLIDDKLKEVDASEKSRAEAETLRQEQHTEREAFLNGFESRVNANEAKNTEQDGRLNSVEYISKRQDVVLSGLLNESGDKRLAITGEGNHLKLEHSKDGVVEVNSVVGNTMVNLSGTPYLATTSNHGVTSDNDYIRLTANGTYRNIFFENIAYKPSTEYTIIIFIRKNTVNANYSVYDNANTDSVFYGSYYNITPGTTGVFITKQTTRADISSCTYGIRSFIGPNATEGEIEVKFVVLEGDYTNKPIPNEYFEGMKSTFDNCLVTQEMIDAGTEKAENLNKYKAELKVVGKNLWSHGDVDFITKHTSWQDVKGTPEAYGNLFEKGREYATVYLSEGYYYISAGEYTNFTNLQFIEAVTEKIITQNRTIYIPKGHYYFRCNPTEIGVRVTIKDLYIEKLDSELDTNSPYEPYKESKQVLYLDEPLYANNELCVHNGQLGYWKNRERVILDGNEATWLDNSTYYPSEVTMMFRFSNPNSNMSSRGIMLCDQYTTMDITQKLDLEGCMQSSGGVIGALYFRVLKSKLTTQDLAGFKLKLQANPITVEYQLAEPIFVPILENMPQWILESFNDCTLSIDSNIPATSMSATYSGNVVSVVALEKVQYQQDTVNLDNAYRLTVLEMSSGGGVV